MLCRNPYVTSGGLTHGCRQCTACKVNKRREWTARLILEALQYHPDDVAFLTLTYNPENLPEDGSLRKIDLIHLIRRLRHHLKPFKVRIFAVGEYGDDTGRPHYHLMLYGYKHCLKGGTDVNKRTGLCCEPCDTMHSLWGKGFITLTPFTTERAQYIAGYVVKKLTKPDDQRLNGRMPEFSIPPRKPALGAHFTHDIASTYLEYNLEHLDDVVPSISFGRKEFPLGRTLTRQLREKIGHEPNAPESNKLKRLAEAKELWDSVRANAVPGFKLWAYKDAIIEKGEGRRIQMEHALRRKKRPL